MLGRTNDGAVHVAQLLVKLCPGAYDATSDAHAIFCPCG